MAQQQDGYPVQLSIDYPDEPLNRLSTFFRLIAVIPILIVLVLITDGFSSTPGDMNGDMNTGGAGFNSAGAGGAIVFATLLMILFRRKYPRWWFDWNLALLRFTTRVTAYLLLLRDEYPSTDEEQAVHLEMAYPDAATDLNRWLPLVKWLLAIPHYIVLSLLGLAVVVLLIISWFAILFTGRYPRDLFNFVVGTMRWAIRVQAYAFLLVTDRYPPFNFSR